jgi:putative SOS response-associated peptidase YedK
LRYNIAPSQQVPVIVRNEERNILKPMRWGLVPSWTDDKAIWQRLINARADTAGKTIVQAARFNAALSDSGRWLL